MTQSKKVRFIAWIAQAGPVVLMVATGFAGWSIGVVAVSLLVLAAVEFRCRRTGRADGAPSEAGAPPPSYAGANESPRPRVEERTIPGMLKQGRHAFVIQQREKWADLPDAEDLLIQAVEQLEARLALVPDGSVLLRRSLNAEPSEHDQEVRVAPFLIDTVVVTNAMYQYFVDAGGYENIDLWPEDILPLVLEFRDGTGQLGPRLWKDSHFPQGHAKRPVVGVNFYEAAAYAKWIGQRIPTDAEWQMAANWRVAGSAKSYQRAFPWGDTMDHSRCNIWPSKIAHAVDVAEYPQGSAPNDVRQLVGNVWEWTTDDLEIWHDNGQPIQSAGEMKCIRGGAYDTFFESQASSEFRTGQNPLARKHNIGFRCALAADEIPILVSA